MLQGEGEHLRGRIELVAVVESKGGKSKAKREVANLKAELRDLIAKVEDGALEPPRGNTMLRGYGVLIDLIKLERGIFVEEDLAARIEELKREPSQAS